MNKNILAQKIISLHKQALFGYKDNDGGDTGSQVLQHSELLSKIKNLTSKNPQFFKNLNIIYKLFPTKSELFGDLKSLAFWETSGKLYKLDSMSNKDLKIVKTLLDKIQKYILDHKADILNHLKSAPVITQLNKLNSSLKMGDLLNYIGMFMKSVQEPTSSPLNIDIKELMSKVNVKLKSLFTSNPRKLVSLLNYIDKNI